MFNANTYIPAPLGIPEILLDIVSYLKRDCCSGGDTALLSLACTSKSFLQPALDAIWKEMVDLVPLIRCLPRDLCTIQCNKDDMQVTVTWLRTSKDGDWSRFAFYTSRITILGPRLVDKTSCGCRTDAYSVDAGFFRELAVYRPTLTVLPNLRSLFWEDCRTLHFAMLFLGTTLTHLELDLTFECSSQVVLALLDHIVMVDLPLKVFKVHAMKEGDDDAQIIAAALSNVVRRMRHLVSVTLPTISTQALHHIAQSSTITTVELWESGSLGTRFPVADGPTAPRAHVRNLYLTIGDLDACLPLFLVMSSNALEELRIRFKTITSRDTLRQLFQAIRSRCNDNFHFLHISRIRDDDDEDETLGAAAGHTIDVPLISSLFPLKSIHTLMIDVTGPSEINDDLLQQIGTCWPHLRYLGLSDYSATPGSTRATLEGLRTLIRLCPQLERVGLLLDTATAATGMLRPGVTNTRLTEIYVGKSYIADVNAVADAISDMLPRVHTIWHRWIPEEALTHEDEEQYQALCDLWDRAEELVRLIGPIRLRERERNNCCCGQDGLHGKHGVGEGK